MEDQYSSCTALLYFFNLIVGTGALTLPNVFSGAGWLLSAGFVTVMAFMSYITATFVIESISRCHSINVWKRLQRMRELSRSIRSAIEPDDAEENYDSTEDSMMLPTEYIESFPSEPQRIYTLDVKVELNTIIDTVFNYRGRVLFYMLLFFYLYGDLTIYSAVVAKSLLDTFCTNVSASANNSDVHCWESYNFTVGEMYKIYLGFFLMLLGPFVFFNVQKTKFLQMSTAVARFFAFGCMIGLAIWRISTPTFEHGSPKMYNWSATPALFGSSIYSFMCHHSLPGLVAPIQNKNRLFTYLALDYLLILVLYLTLALTAVFAFPTIADLYTLNFDPENAMAPALKSVGYILALFPVYTLTTNFPIIAVTLRGNLQAVISHLERPFLHSIVLPLMAVVPPVLVAMSTMNIETLVYVTGALGGLAIQYMIPVVIVVLTRRQTPPNLVHVPNPYASPFKSSLWPFLVFMWGILCYYVVFQDIFDKNLLHM